MAPDASQIASAVSISRVRRYPSRSRVFFVCAIVGLCCAALGAYAQQRASTPRPNDAVFERITAHSLELIDRTGAVRIRLVGDVTPPKTPQDSFGPGLSFFGVDGTKRLDVSMTHDGLSVVAFSKKNERVLSLSMDEDGVAFTIRDPSGGSVGLSAISGRGSLTVRADGDAEVVISAAKRNAAVSVASAAQPLAWMRGHNGNGEVATSSQDGTTTGHMPDAATKQK